MIKTNFKTEFAKIGKLFAELGSTYAARVLLIFGVIAIVATGITYVMYNYTEQLLTERLQERLVSIASTAATRFNPEEIEEIKTPSDMSKNEMKVLVRKLQEIRSANSNIQYAYLMRRTNDPSIVEFVADADSLVPFEELDINENGLLEEDELVPIPGDPYEVSDYPVLRDEAFFHPSVDRDLQPDQWGLIMAAYAPIFDEKGSAVAIVGVDVLVDDFREKTQSTLLPFLLFVFVLIFLLMLMTLILMRVNQERLEVLRELDRQKDELLSIVSHQLATPVSSIKWSLELLNDGDIGKITKDQQEHVGKMQKTASNLADLVSMILDVSRIQLGRMRVDRTPLNLNEFFQEVMDTIDVKAQQKGVEFVKKIPKKLPVGMFDKRLMRMTLENLLSNAVKYTPEKGKVTLTVTVKNGNLTYTVTDTGCGIPKDDHDKVFGKMFRASNVQKIDGNGFGLYIAKGGVEGQGGSISFKSAENKGTEFTVVLPLVIEKDSKK